MDTGQAMDGSLPPTSHPITNDIYRPSANNDTLSIDHTQWTPVRQWTVHCPLHLVQSLMTSTGHQQTTDTLSIDHTQWTPVRQWTVHCPLHLVQSLTTSTGHQQTTTCCPQITDNGHRSGNGRFTALYITSNHLLRVSLSCVDSMFT